MDSNLNDTPGPVSNDQMNNVLALLQKSLVTDLEDEDQNKLVEALQQNRALILKYAMQKYLESPKSASLLEGVLSLLAHMEKTVRDNRKEKAKKKEGESNVIAFNQMMDALKTISSGAVALPAFELSSFILDPSKSLIPAGANITPISPAELVQGNSLIDINGEPV